MKNYQFKSKECIVCQTTNDELVSKKGQFGIPLNVVICKSCGLTYLNPRWTEESYANFYQNEYDDYYRAKQVDEVYDFEKSKFRQYGYYPVWLRLQDAGIKRSYIKSVLDVGAGNGLNLEYLKSRLLDEATYFAIEPSIACKKILQTKNIEFLSQDINDGWDESKKYQFDLVLIRHVLEHLDDPVASLQKVGKNMSPEGLVYIAVPNSLKIKNTSLKDFFFRVVHTYYFTPNSLKNVARLAGFKVLAIEEGDFFNETEIYIVLQKSEDEAFDVASVSNEYDSLRKLFEKRIKYERTFSYFLDKQFGKLRNILFQIHRKFFPHSSFLKQ